MKDVLIRCFSNNNVCNRYYINIFDCNNKKIISSSMSNFFKFSCCSGLYKVIISCYEFSTFGKIIVSDNYNIFGFYIDSFIPITIRYVDKNYFNLPMERGKIYLWQDHIQ